MILLRIMLCGGWLLWIQRLFQAAPPKPIPKIQIGSPYKMATGFIEFLPNEDDSNPLVLWQGGDVVAVTEEVMEFDEPRLIQRQGNYLKVGHHHAYITAYFPGHRLYLITRLRDTSIQSVIPGV